MVFYVVYKASEGFKNRSLIPRRLRALGCRQVCKSFWEVEEKKANKVLKVLHKNQPILLKRIREIRKPKFVKEKGVYELGSLVIIAYRTPKEVKRGKIKSFLKKAPCIRLCRSVYAFYQEHSRFDKDNQLVDAGRFWRFIQEIQEDVKVVPRVVVVNSDSVERLLDETKKRVENKIDDIVRCCKELYQRACKGESNARYICGRLSKLNRSFVTVKRVAAFYEKWLRIDFSKNLMKPYGVIRKVRFVVTEK